MFVALNFQVKNKKKYVGVVKEKDIFQKLKIKNMKQKYLIYAYNAEKKSVIKKKLSLLLIMEKLILVENVKNVKNLI